MGDNRGDTDTHTGTDTDTDTGATGRKVEDDGPVRPDLNPVRAAGWYFRDGDCIAIERQSEDVRTRVLAD